jgi:hypothetical protein
LLQDQAWLDAVGSTDAACHSPVMGLVSDAQLAGVQWVNGHHHTRLDICSAGDRERFSQVTAARDLQDPGACGSVLVNSETKEAG